MQGVEISHLNACMGAAIMAYYELRRSTVEDALRPISRYGKKDTLGMDAGPEITICERLRRYDAGAVVITEEVGTRGLKSSDNFRSRDPETFRTVFICDPTDRSNQLKAFLAKYPKEMRIEDILENPETAGMWEKDFGYPVER